MKRLAILLCLTAAVFATAARAQSAREIEQRRAALIETWKKTPLTLRNAVFVTDRPQGYGIYEKHASPVFKTGEPIIIYFEPVGFGWKKAGDGLVEFGFDIDILLKSANDKISYRREKFMKFAKKSHHRNLEMFLNLMLTGMRPGDYIVAYTVHDIATGKSATIERSFKVSP